MRDRKNKRKIVAKTTKIVNLTTQIEPKILQSSKKTYNQVVTTNSPPGNKQSENTGDMLVQIIRMLKY